MTSYFEDIFEAEDSLPPEPPIDLQSEQYSFFSALSGDWGHPYLHYTVLRKLSKIIDQVSQPAKRHNYSIGYSPSAKDNGGFQNVDVMHLMRILKILERTVKGGEELDPFVGPKIKASNVQPSPAKSNKGGKKTKRTSSPGGRRSKSTTPMDLDEELGTTESVEIDTEKLETALLLGKESLLAADACLALLGADYLPKQASFLVYSI